MAPCHDAVEMDNRTRRVLKLNYRRVQTRYYILVEMDNRTRRVLKH